MMSHFVILIHDHPFVHWDFLVQRGDVLQSWRLQESPDRWQLARNLVQLPAEAIGDHRLAYLDYEGAVSRERGKVVRWDQGRAEWIERTVSMVRLQVEGHRLQGELVLEHVSSQAFWTARFSPAASH